MKTLILLTVMFVLFISATSFIAKSDFNKEKNKAIAEKYHLLEASDIDNILCEDFIGRNEKSKHTWNKSEHFNYLTNGVFKEDSICHQIVDGDWVATRFVRTIDLHGKNVKFEAMHFKRFRNGKIAEIWEYGDSDQVNY